MRIWMFTRAEGRIARQTVVEVEGLEDALRMLAETLDCPRPVLLRKHEGEWERFGRTVFRPGDFVEPVSFDRLEIDSLREPNPNAREPLA